MAKKGIPGQSAATIRKQRTEAYAQSVKRIFDATRDDILKLKLSLPKTEDGVMYSFDGDTQQIQKRVADLLKRLHASATLAIQKGVQVEWEKANAECDDIIKQSFGKKLLESDKFRAWTSHNEEAMKTFMNRSDRGMNLSDRVWKSAQQFRDELEVAITVGAGSGDSAASMSRAVRQCLNDPDLMFRRFRYKAGEEKIFDPKTGEQIGTKPIWGKKWKKKIKDADGKTKWIDYDKDSYIPKGAGDHSRGVYKSAYKNAMRVTRTETNMAYRRADYERWQKMTFVLGFKVQTSNQHPDFDICDSMEGDYPKTFYFSGWHPHCFCYATPILVDKSEMQKVTDEFLQGRVYQPQGQPILDTPKTFKRWIYNNSDRITNANALPYWIKDNPAFVDAKHGQAITPDPETITKLFPKNAEPVIPQKTQAEIDAEIDQIMKERTKTEIVTGGPEWQGFLADEIDACKTHDEITALLKKNGIARSTSFKDMDLDGVKTIAKVSAEIQKRFSLEPFAINSKDFHKSGVLMHAHGGFVETNSVYWDAKHIGKTIKTTYDDCVTDWIADKERYIKQLKSEEKFDLEMAKEFRNQGNENIAEYYEKQAKRSASKAKKEQKLLDSGMSRHNVFLSRETMLRDCFTHETGHTLHDQILGGLNGYSFRQKRIDVRVAEDFNDELDALFKKYKSKAGWLSEYGTKKRNEFMAESSVLYMYQPEKLPADVLDWFKRVEEFASPAKQITKKVGITREEAKKIYESREKNRAIAAQRHAQRPEGYREQLLERRRITQEIDQKVKEAEKYGYSTKIQDIKDYVNGSRFSKNSSLTNETLQKRLDRLTSAIKSENKLIQHTANNVVNVAAKYGYDANIKALAEAVKNETDIISIRTKTRELAKAIGEEKKGLAEITDLIPDAQRWRTKFSMAELKGAHAAIKTKFDRWIWDFDTDASLTWLKNRLETEISAVETRGKKYSTWEVSREAYQRRLDLVKKRIDMKAVKDNIADKIAILENEKGKVSQRLLDEFEKAFKDNDTDLAALKDAATKIEKKAANIQAKIAAKKTKKVSGTPGSMTDDEIREAFIKYIGTGSGIKEKDIVIRDGFIDMAMPQHKAMYKQLKRTTADERQTHSRSGSNGYIGTGNSFAMNGALRDINGGGKHAIRGDISKADTTICADMYGHKLKPDDIDTIKALDRIISANPTPAPIRMCRFVNEGAIENMTGVKWPDLQKKISQGTAIQAEDLGYMSVSTNTVDNYFKDVRDFMLEIEVPKGTPLYVTSNTSESECILGRGTKLEFIDIREEFNGYGNSHKLNVIRCRLIP